MSHLPVTPNDYQGTDSQRINQAARDAAALGRALVIPRINQSPQAGRPTDRWLLDEAILLPSRIRVELDDCHIQLSDRCRDNIFRSANCGLGVEKIEPAHDIYIVGKGRPLLQGADHPRSTGDSAKTLGQQTYGTDAGVDGESQTGDWRNIGILLAHVQNFAITNVTLVDTHCWAISHEYCSHGLLRDIRIESTGRKMIDGLEVKILNQDGIDLRQGCHDFLIENITGFSGDDLIALTAIPHQDRVAGTLGFTMITDGSDTTSGISQVIIRNVRGQCAGGHHIIRLLNTSGLPMEDVVIDGLIDTSQPPRRSHAAVKIGDSNPRWGGVNPPGTTKRINVRNITTRATYGVLIGGSLDDSIISDVIQYDHDAQMDEKFSADRVIHYQAGHEHVRQTAVTNCRRV